MRLAAFVPLATPRLSLVALTLEHAPAVFAHAGDPDISELVAWPRHRTLDDSRLWIARQMIGYVRGGHYEWGIVRQADQTLVGSCGFGWVDTERGVADVGYALARPYWGQGYATEAVAAVIGFGIQQLGLSAIEALALPQNLASQQVLAKLGMRYVEMRRLEPTEATEPRQVQAWRLERERWGVTEAARARTVRAPSGCASGSVR